MTRIKPFFNSRLAGFLLVIACSTFLLILFYGKILFSLNTTFFSAEGDGITSYYNSSYQAIYDTTLFRSKSMNYPYGEAYIFTQPQILIVAPIKCISHHIIDITGYTVGIINSLMLISIVLAAIFLYCTLQRFGVPIWIAALAAVAIAFLSPQINRMSGHFTLSYVWALPALIYILFMFHTHARKTIFSILTGLVLFILITGHIYFAVFYFAVLIVYWLFIIITDLPKSFKKYLWIFGQFLLQFLLPVFIYFLIAGYFNDKATERPSIPFGFLLYKSWPAGIFLPLGMEYGKLLQEIKDFSYLQWEGIAYIGFMGVVGFLILVAGMMRKLFKGKWRKITEVTDNQYLNILFWSSVILLLYSFGVPFIFNLEYLVDYLGPLKQLRALGRFSWLFYFVINLVVIYNLSQWQSKKAWRTGIVWLALIILFADVYFFSKGRQDFMNNSFPAWVDRNNTLPENQLISDLDISTYQAIIPLPFYHMGSENFNIPNRCSLLAKSCLVSIKTGLPIMAIYSGRASVTYTVKNIAPFLEPYRNFEILKDLPSKKPFLIVSVKCPDLNQEELNLIENSVLIDSSSEIILYRLEFDSLAMLPGKKAKEVKEIFSKLKLEPDILYKSPSTTEILVSNFDSILQVNGYMGNSEQIKGRSALVLFKGSLKNPNAHKYQVSFWLYPVNRDLYPKTRLLVELFDQKDTKYGYLNVMCGDFIKAFDGSWGLIEFPFELKDPADHIQIALYNDLIRKDKNYQVDEVMIRPDSCDIMLKTTSFIMLNNRWYPSE